MAFAFFFDKGWHTPINMFEFVQNNKLLMRIILGAVALTFVGFGVGSYTMDSSNPSLAEVDGVKIYGRDLSRLLDGAGQVNDAANRKAGLEALIQNELLLAEARARGIVVSDAQLAQAIAAIPAFQKDGKFDEKQYHAALEGRYPSTIEFESELRRSLIINELQSSLFATNILSKQLLGRLQAAYSEVREVEVLTLKPATFAEQVDTSPDALKTFYQANLRRFRSPERIKVDYVILSQEDLAKKINVSDAEAQKYFNQRQAEFGKEERKASHILLAVPKDASAEQKAKTKAEAEAILAAVRANPARFAELAKEKSQDPVSAEKGGDLGFAERGVMVKPFDDVLFKMQPGQISDLVATEYGYHIIRLDEVSLPTFEKFKASVIEKIQNQQSAAQFRADSDKLSELAYQQSKSLSAIQSALKLSVQQSDWLGRNPPASPVEGAILEQAKVLAAAFSDDVLKKKNNSEPISIGNNRLLVLRVAIHQPEQQQSLASVQEQIRAELVAKEGVKLAEKKGVALLAMLKAGQDSGQAWEMPQMLTRMGDDKLAKSDKQAVFTASATKLPAYTGVKQNNGDYVIYRITKVTALPSNLAPPMEQVAGFIGQVSQATDRQQYLEALRQKYKVTRNPRVSLDDA